MVNRITLKSKLNEIDAKYASSLIMKKSN